MPCRERKKYAKEELIEFLEDIGERLLLDVDDEETMLMRAVIAVLSRNSTPVLRRWTKEDGTPPDGLYFTDMVTGSVVIKLAEGKPVFDFPAATEEAERLRSNLWEFLDVSLGKRELYGPIDCEICLVLEAPIDVEGGSENEPS